MHVYNFFFSLNKVVSSFSVHTPPNLGRVWLAAYTSVWPAQEEKGPFHYPHSLLGLHSTKIKALLGLHPWERSNRTFFLGQARVMQP